MEFHVAFQITRTIIFNVSYYTLGGNREPYFATSAMRYVRSKRSVCEAGQCQDRLLTGKAKAFWRKWDEHHLGQLTQDQIAELLADMDALTDKYNHVAKFADTFRGTHSGIGATEHYRLSMQPLKA